MRGNECKMVLSLCILAGFLPATGLGAAPARPQPQPGEWRELGTWNDWDPTVPLALSPDGKHVATVLRLEEKVVIRDARTGKEVVSWKAAGVASLLAYSPNGKSLAFCENGAVEVREAATGKSVHTVAKAGTVVSPQEVRFSPDGQSLAVSSIRSFDNIPQTSDLFVWEAPSGKTLTHVAVRGERRLNFFTYVVPLIAPDFKSYLTYGHVDGTLKLWDRAAKRVQGALPARLPVAASVLWSSDGKSLALLGNQGAGKVQVWDVRARKLKWTFRLVEGTAPFGWSWSPDSKVLALGGKGEVVLYDCTTGQVQARLPMPKDWISQRVQFSAEGEHLAALGHIQEPGKVGDGVLRTWTCSQGSREGPGK
jgi:WD40 repeat protein